MDLWSIIQLILTIIGGASVILGAIAPLTKNKTDDKILAFLKKILEAASLHVKEDGKLTINIKKQ
jgi:hypothetical protein